MNIFTKNVLKMHACVCVSLFFQCVCSCICVYRHLWVLNIYKCLCIYYSMPYSMLYYVNGNKTSSLENNLAAISVLASFEKITNLLIDMLMWPSPYFFSMDQFNNYFSTKLNCIFFLSEATQNHYKRRIGVPTRFC